MKAGKSASARTLRAPSAPRIGIRRPRTLRSTGRRGLHDLLELYRNLSGFHASTIGYSNYATTYGEVTPKGIQMLSDTFQKHAPGRRHFIDLGCGAGRVVLGMAILHPTLQCRGIEIIPERVRVAHQALERLHTPTLVQRIQIQQGDLLDTTLSLKTAEWVFISNLMFEDPTQAALAAKLESELPKGAVVICSKDLPLREGSPLTCVESTLRVPMSWSASSTCVVYKKTG